MVILNWVDYLAPQVEAAFEAETGHTLKTVYFDKDNERDEILVSAAGKNFDIAIMDNVAVKQFTKSGALHPLPDALYDNIDEEWRSACGNTGLPYFWGTLGLAYRLDKFDSPPRSWRALMMPAPRIKGHIAMQTDSVDLLLPALKTLGLPMNTENIDDLKRAYHLLQEQQSSVLTYEYIVSYYDTAADKDDIYLALVFSGDQNSLNLGEPSPRWGYSIPEEGSSLWLDCLVILDSSDHKPAAEQFLAFINRPDIAALNAEVVGPATPNTPARALLDAGILNDEATYPPQSVIKNSTRYHLLTPETIGLRSRIVNAVTQAAHKNEEKANVLATDAGRQE